MCINTYNILITVYADAKNFRIFFDQQVSERVCHNRRCSKMKRLKKIAVSLNNASITTSNTNWSSRKSFEFPHSDSIATKKCPQHAKLFYADQLVLYYFFQTIQRVYFFFFCLHTTDAGLGLQLVNC